MDFNKKLFKNISSIKAGCIINPQIYYSKNLILLEI